MDIYHFSQQSGPLLVSVPHAGTELSSNLESRMTETALELPDTDWHADRLVEFCPELEVSLLRARYSRYVIDLNRGADDRPLYSGPVTGLIPEQTFSGDPVYRDDPPDDSETRERIARYWRPYHMQLERALKAIKARYGFAVLLDTHSIRSRVPRFFEGQLPDLNLGTFEGRSCDPELQRRVAEVLVENREFTHVINGRFKGGYITRHYGQPERGIHAIQIEIAQCCYMDESRPRHWDEKRAAPLKQLLRQLVDGLISWRPE